MKRIMATFLIIVMLVSFVVPFFMGQDEHIETESTTVRHSAMAGIVDIVKVPKVSKYTELRVVSREEAKIETAINLMNKDMEAINSIEDRKEWFVAYKSIVDKYSYILDPPLTIYDFYNDSELNMLFCVVQAEIGDEYSFEQKCNVASVIFNRIDNDKFPNTMFEVLTSDQFETISNEKYKSVEVSEDTILACEYVFQIEDTTDGCLFFDSNNTLNYTFVFNDGAHNYYRLKEEI